MKIKKISRKELNIIAESFADYEFQNGEKGLYYLCKGRQGRIDFVKGYALLGLYSSWFNTISDKREGYICIQESDDKEHIRGVWEFVRGIRKGMGLFGGIRFAFDYIKAGTPIEKLLKKEGFVHIRMLVIRKEYQGKGYMRKLVQLAFDKASERKVPCIVSTDAYDKAVKYEHLGFKLFRKRRMSKQSTEYDMIWYPD